jgi:preprotein translocase subunit SecD
VVRETFRRSVVAEDPSVSDSALRRQEAKVRMSVAAQNRDRSLQLTSQSRRLQARLQVKRGAREKEGKAPMVNNLPGRHHQEVEHPLLGNAARHSHNMERNNQRKEHHRQDHNNAGVVFDSGSGKKNSRAAFLDASL